MSQTITIEERLDHAAVKKPLPHGAFKGPHVYRLELPPGMLLYKVTYAGAATRAGEIAVNAAGFVTPWWFSYESLEVNDPRHGTVAIRGVDDIAHHVKRTRSDFRQYLRSRGAVCYDWNDMTHLLVIELGRPVVSLMGTCSSQPLVDDIAQRHSQQTENVRFIGGEQQFYVPGLRRSDVIVHQFGTIA